MLEMRVFDNLLIAERRHSGDARPLQHLHNLVVSVVDSPFRYQPVQLVLIEPTLIFTLKPLVFCPIGIAHDTTECSPLLRRGNSDAHPLILAPTTVAVVRRHDSVTISHPG